MAEDGGTEALERLRAEVAALARQKQGLARLLILLLLGTGGRAEITGAPTMAAHLMLQHFCMNAQPGQHGPACRDVVEAHAGPDHACRAAGCGERYATMPCESLDTGSHLRAAVPPVGDRFSRLMLAAEERQHPERN